MLLATLILLFHIPIFDCSSTKKSLLSLAISEVLSKYPLGWPNLISSEFNREKINTSTYEELCSNIADRDRLACCRPQNDLHYLRNVQFEKGKMIFYTGKDRTDADAKNADGSPRTKLHSLPSIDSRIRRELKHFKMNVINRFEEFDKSKCRKYFNGTLHVSGRFTTNNLFHLMNDNILALLSQVVLDAYSQPDMLHAPRALLVGFQPSDREELPHLSIMKVIAPHSFTVDSADGVCFARVVWGSGVHVIYHHLLVSIRRTAADLLRQVVRLAYRPPDPYTTLPARNIARTDLVQYAAYISKFNQQYHINESRSKSPVSTNEFPLVTTKCSAAYIDAIDYSHSSPAAATSSSYLPLLLWTKSKKSISQHHTTTIATAAATDEFCQMTNPRPLQIVIMTRGNSGKGRSIQGETYLRDRLLDMGAKAVICCDFSAPAAATGNKGGGNLTSYLGHQLSYGYHADVIIGLHGAGLMNNIYAPRGVITVELKTIYGYTLSLFALASEARLGTLIELNIKAYHIWTRPQSTSRPIDEPLVSRVTDALHLALQRYQQQQQQQQSNLLWQNKNINGSVYDVVPENKTTDLIYDNNNNNNNNSIGDRNKNKAISDNNNNNMETTEDSATSMTTTLNHLLHMNYRKDLFQALSHLGPYSVSGDLVIFSYPLEQYERDQLTAHTTTSTATATGEADENYYQQNEHNSENAANLVLLHQHTSFLRAANNNSNTSHLSYVLYNTTYNQNSSGSSSVDIIKAPLVENLHTMVSNSNNSSSGSTNDIPVYRRLNQYQQKQLLPLHTYSKLDFLLHVLGPKIEDIKEQCSLLTMNSFWTYVNADTKEYCTTSCLVNHNKKDKNNPNNIRNSMIIGSHTTIKNNSNEVNNKLSKRTIINQHMHTSTSIKNNLKKKDSNNSK